jgi:hypothetical protein
MMDLENCTESEIEEIREEFAAIRARLAEKKRKPE